MSNHDIQSHLIAKIAISDSQLHRACMYLFNSILSLRATDSSKVDSPNDNDFILSPVEPFFDSRKNYKGLPDNGDANGAYNIARKGNCILQKINKIKKGERADLLIRKDYWQNYTQNSEIVSTQLKKLNQE